MAHSSWGSGWPHCQTDKLLKFTAGGRPWTMRREVVPIFRSFIDEIVSRGYIISEGQLDDWSWNCRAIAGTTIPSNHCLTGDTEIICYDGKARIGDLAGTTVSLLTRSPYTDSPYGRWDPASIRAYGAQDVHAIRLSRGSDERTVRATATHRWFAKRLGGTVDTVTTDSLVAGDRLCPVHPPSSPRSKPWEVVTVTPAGSEEVYCATVAGTGAFGLADGLLTGNSFGLAVDINSLTNPMTFNGRLVTNVPGWVTECATAHGLTWGGNYSGSKKDPMHFEWTHSLTDAAAMVRHIAAVDGAMHQPAPAGPSTGSSFTMSEATAILAAIGELKADVFRLGQRVVAIERSVHGVGEANDPSRDASILLAATYLRGELLAGPNAERLRKLLAAEDKL